MTLEFQTAQFLFRERKKLLPCELQSKFQEGVGGYKLREELNFRIPKHRTTISILISVLFV